VLKKKKRGWKLNCIYRTCKDRSFCQCNVWCSCKLPFSFITTNEKLTSSLRTPLLVQSSVNMHPRNWKKSTYPVSRQIRSVVSVSVKPVLVLMHLLFRHVQKTRATIIFWMVQRCGSPTLQRQASLLYLLMCKFYFSFFEILIVLNHPTLLVIYQKDIRELLLLLLKRNGVFKSQRRRKR
jgi:hypothetical protein